MPYDASIIRRFYDQYGNREWERFDGRAQDAVNLHIHTHYLRHFIEPGMNVLDAGAGPGRFTMELARVGACVTVVDISDEMLRQNRERVGAAGLESAVEARLVADITELNNLEDESFDAVVCYGGPLSYVMDRADDALGELLRVAKPKAPLLLSVMSTLGSTRSALPVVIDLVEEVGAARILDVLNDGNLTYELFRNDHVMKMYRWQELKALLDRHPCSVELVSASNFLSTGRSETLDELVPDPETQQAFLDWEVRCCQEPGAWDGGTHLLAAVRKMTSAE